MEKKRVVAYVRVSSKSSAQLHSYEFQERYWQDKFADDPQRELVGIYADRGISGSSVKKRTEFLRMMDDARSGRIDQIQTKSVCPLPTQDQLQRAEMGVSHLDVLYAIHKREGRLRLHPHKGQCPEGEVRRSI